MRWLFVVGFWGVVACGAAATPPSPPQAVGSPTQAAGSPPQAAGSPTQAVGSPTQAAGSSTRHVAATEPAAPESVDAPAQRGARSVADGAASPVKGTRGLSRRVSTHEVKAHAAAEARGAESASAAPRPFGEPVVPREQTVVRVLLYHAIGKKTTRPSVTPRAFAEQLGWLRANGIEVIRLSQLLDFLDGELLLPRHAAVITIDDGEINGYRTAFPMLKEYGMPFSLGIATEVIEQHWQRGAMNWDQIREMVASGWCEVASHSVTHRRMTSLPDEVARRELDRSRRILTEALGHTPDAFFYPLGAEDRRIRRLTKQSGYRAGFVAHGGPTVATTPRFGIPRYDVRPGLPMRLFRSFFNHEIRMSPERAR